jgi:DNA-binding transcriptional MerR regulator
MSQTTPGAECLETWKVGTLAHATGLTVRTLHHYDHVGLLKASGRSAAGHRQYSPDDVARLYRIQFLRRMDFSLAEIAHALDDPDWEMKKAIEVHLRDTDRRLAVASRLRGHLQILAFGLSRDRSPATKDLLSALEEMTMLDSTVHNTISLLVYDDIEAAQKYITRVYGLTGGDLERDASGTVKHGEVRAGGHVIWLHPPGEEFQSPGNLGAVTGMTVIMVDDVDEHHKAAVAAGAQIIEEPVDQPYGAREYGARDLEGQLWFFHSTIDN